MRVDNFLRSNPRPATLALVLQALAFIVAFVMILVLRYFSAEQITPNLQLFFLMFALLQACVATLLSRLLGMARWWHFIHFFFPIFVWLMSNIAVSSEVYLVAFIVTLSLYWTTFRTQVPFYPSGPFVWQQVSNLISDEHPSALIEIGSGLGDMSMAIAKNKPNCQVLGVEIAPLPWLVSKCRSLLRRSSADFVLGDYRRYDFKQFDIVFAYLSPAAMPALWIKAQREMQKGSLLISYEFEIPDAQPKQVIGSESSSKLIYIWRM